MKKISVIIPVYNMEKYLKCCMESLVSQTYKDLEIICVNDGSQDNSLNILEEYAQKDERIKIINKVNGGLSSARNVGIEVATSEFVTFLDADDWLESNAYEVLSKHLGKADVIVFGTTVTGDAILYKRQLDNEYYRVKFSGFKILDDEARLKTDVSAWTKIYKRSIIKDNNLRFPIGKHYEDFTFYWKYILLCETAYFEEARLHNYLRRDDSIMANTFKKSSNKVLDHLYAAEDIFEFMQAHDIYGDHKKTFVEIFGNCFWFCFHHQKKNRHLSLCKQAHDLLGRIDIDDEAESLINKLKHKKYYKISTHCYSFLQNLFSILKMKEGRKVISVLGIKISIKSKKEESQDIEGILNELKLENTELKRDFLYKYFDDISSGEKSWELGIDTENPKVAICPILDCKYLNYIFDNIKFYSVYDADFVLPDYYFAWGMHFYNEQYQALKMANFFNKPVFIFEDGFLRSIDTWVNAKAETKYRTGISFTVDNSNAYFDATRASRLEKMLNDKNLVISDREIERARICINKIVETNLTKYNHQPIETPEIGREGVKKVLVVDQSFGDMSIAKGLANEVTFKEMLDAAIAENPEADIIVKTHPDTIAGAGGYYKGLLNFKNVYTMTHPINPISLIKYCDKVYVCTTQLGFEALMCGKETHVFGMPFYAGWGLTNDRKKLDRRTNSRTLEEIFYITYIMYSYYVNPDKKCRCEIEEAMDYLLTLRDEYFGSVKNG